MAHDVDLQQTILRKTLDEVAESQSGCNDVNLNPCVICLDQVTEGAIALPCEHGSFDFLCLLSWLQQRPSCPLCQAVVSRVKYELESDLPSGPKIYYVPAPQSPPTARHPESAAGTAARFHPRRFRRRPRRDQPQPEPPAPDDPIIRRRHIYRHQLYSRRVGSNRLSQYRELTPQHFNEDTDLVSRARTWIRRELRVFAFLNPHSTEGDGSSTTADNSGERTINNAEFLLEYIIAILRTVDIKGSGGQAEELLQEFIGRDHARLFLHELQAWLRSPYNSLTDWDRVVQYDEEPAVGDERFSLPRAEVETAGDAGRYIHSTSRSSSSLAPSFTSRNRDRRRSCPGRISKRTGLTGNRVYARDTHDGYSSVSRARRIQRARDRYQPD
ncbi:RING finger domain-containing protein [Paracoccidioides lutzii Pb01]|uniref:RING-type E3 ubiquitin transferase n=1 Tax=Paracoccidioides lutzii (strain ATCC MYA-826 / Pb01) TaxID=502779 RepID=C1GWU0_PARBA|nr:RING finger domain-containing protein [Paracoccidioides lutzii Pb01]EEH41028.1 RING finger domain-containing protein [Paracoccidioides lutzii Pb01]